MPTEPDLNRTLTDENVRKAAVSCLAELFPEEMAGYLADKEMVLDVLVLAAAKNTSLAGACESLGTVVTDDTIRNHLNASLAKRDLYSLNLAINKVLQADLPRRVRRGRWHIAIDLHDQPYYGHSAAVDKWVHRSQRKAGTGRFLRIATAYLMHDGLRYTLAMKIVGPGQRLEDIVAWLIQSVRRAGIGVRRYWLDRGFASGAVVARLEAMRVSAIIACSVRGQSGGTRSLCRGYRTHGQRFTFQGQSGPWSAYVSAVRKLTKRRGKPRRWRWFLYIQVGTRIPDDQIHAFYRRRFGIETSYRLMNQVRPRTTSRLPALRFLFMAVALILLNLWVSLCYRFCRTIRDEKDFFDLDRLRLRRFRDFLCHAVDRIHHAVLLITALDPALDPLGT